MCDLVLIWSYLNSNMRYERHKYTKGHGHIYKAAIAKYTAEQEHTLLSSCSIDIKMGLTILTKLLSLFIKNLIKKSSNDFSFRSLFLFRPWAVSRPDFDWRTNGNCCVFSWTQMLFYKQYVCVNLLESTANVVCWSRLIVLQEDYRKEHHTVVRNNQNIKWQIPWKQSQNWCIITMILCIRRDKIH